MKIRRSFCEPITCNWYCNPLTERYGKWVQCKVERRRVEYSRVEWSISLFDNNKWPLTWWLHSKCFLSPFCHSLLLYLLLSSFFFFAANIFTPHLYRSPLTSPFNLLNVHYDRWVAPTCLPLCGVSAKSTTDWDTKRSYKQERALKERTKNNKILNAKGRRMKMYHDDQWNIISFLEIWVSCELHHVSVDVCEEKTKKGWIIMKFLILKG